jgi:hypothetical protein
LPRAALAALTVSVALVGLLAAGASGSGRQPSVALADTITVRARLHDGLWQKSLSLKLVKTRLIGFTLCAVWDKPATQKFSCKAGSGAQLPAGTHMRLEQSPIFRAVRRSDSPGWGMLGRSDDAFLGAGLSNTVSGDKFGTVKYRVTLRDSSEKVLLTSNIFTVVWRR